MESNSKKWLLTLLATSVKVFSFMTETEKRLREFDIQLDDADRDSVIATTMKIQAINNECLISHGGIITPGSDFAFRNLAMLLDCVEVHHAIYAKTFEVCDCDDCRAYELDYTICRAMIRALAQTEITPE